MNDIQFFRVISEKQFPFVFCAQVCDNSSFQFSEIELVCDRYQASDFSGQMLAEVSALKTPRPAFAPLFSNQFGINHQNWVNKVSSKVQE
jgi:hypothetical protein